MDFPQPSTRVLVVDDNPMSLYATTKMLRAAGFQVSEATRGEDALARALSELPDAVVLDVNLPDIDGFEVCRRLRAQVATARLPVLHLSSTFLDDRSRVRGLDAGADGYLTHPVEPPVLVATVNALVRARNAEHAVRRREAELRAIFELAPSGICLLDRQLVFREVNPALAAMLGTNAGDLVGHSCTESLVAGDRGGLEAWAAAPHRTGPWRGLLTCRSKGELAQLEWTVSEYTVPETLLAVVSDVTERFRHEQDRERLLASERSARAEAERANRLKDEFLAMLSHELRTPLNAIVGWVHVLQAQSPTPQDLAKGLTVIERNARLQAQLISDLFDVSRIISGKLSLDSDAVDLAETIRAALDGVRATADAKNITLDLRLAPVPAIRGDAGRLQQVVWNLVHNAVKFSASGGRVEVAVRQEGDHTVVDVKDSGIGISPDFLPQMFDMFRQERTGPSRTHGGLGLGLGIVKQIVELHGGSVSAHSDGVGRGATFTVRLPLAPPQAVAPDAEPHRPTLHGLRLLVVDDDGDARAFLGRVLTDAGAVVEEADSTADALEAFARVDPHLIVSDIGMPDRDGYDLIRCIRLSGAEVPAIALTAYARRQDEHRALEAGFQFHLSKPFDSFALIHAIARLARTHVRET